MHKLKLKCVISMALTPPSAIAKMTVLKQVSPQVSPLTAIGQANR